MGQGNPLREFRLQFSMGAQQMTDVGEIGPHRPQFTDQGKRLAQVQVADVLLLRRAFSTRTSAPRNLSSSASGMVLASVT